MKRRILAAEEGGIPAWALTYADMLSVMLVFFVLLISYSNMDLIRYRAMVDSLKQAFGAQTPSSPVETPGLPGIAAGATANRLAVEKDLAAFVREFGPGGPLQILYSPEGLRVRIEGQVLFQSGTANLLPGAGAILSKLAPILAKYPYQIWVEGHTDDVPIATPAFPSNWELSAGRAGRVVRELAALGVPSARLSAVGYAETRPAVPNTDDAGRARNRRVEVFLSRNTTAWP